MIPAQRMSPATHALLGVIRDLDVRLVRARLAARTTPVDGAPVTDGPASDGSVTGAPGFGGSAAGDGPVTGGSAADDVRVLEDRRRGAVRALRAVVAGRHPGDAPEAVDARLLAWGVVP
ncbi:hypothetical protein [Streptomyces sp. ST2-7A]|uniref:hypothetical protein n=1 Tax=Streptomyces sp. ST2-7A TaxID=2907214 RepID=UPI001F43F7A4|nr:hypothetical protein [Streptomyces sp. ST2-7A]MCE7080858.1 hypothetical protein [Streptomyces sp. ST2-7A]